MRRSWRKSGSVLILALACGESSAAADATRSLLFRRLAAQARAYEHLRSRSIQRRRLSECVETALVKNLLLEATKGSVEAISQKLAGLSQDQLARVHEGVTVELADGRTVELGPEFYEVEKRITSERGELESISVAGFAVLIYR